MIFSRECDRTLWLILAGDDKNREAIVSFIESIPYELYDKIEESLEKLNQYGRDNVSILDRDMVVDSAELYVSNDYKYWFSVDMILGTFNIGRSFNGQKDIDITLYANGMYNRDGQMDEQILGYIDFGVPRLGGVCYELSNTFVGPMVVSSKNRRLKKYRRVNTNMIPDDVDIFELKRNNGRSRCRKRYY